MKMRFRKRYLMPLVFLSTIGLCRSEFVSFRQSDEDQQQALLKEGLQPHFDSIFHQNHIVHYTQVGDTSRPPVILFHGSPGSSSAFMSYLKDSTLLAHSQVIALDRPGYGYSNYGQTEPSLEQQAAAVAPLLNQFTSPPILVGHSYGGPVIARLAMDYPDKVGGIVLVAGSMDPDLEPREWWRKPADTRALRWMFPKSMVVCNQEIMALHDELLAMEPLWVQVECPVTVIQGRRDKLVPAGNAAYVKEKAVNSQALNVKYLEDGNHFVLWTEQSLIVESILDQLSLQP
jgi:pimeloyl-ACP methyl ester carboxylesterase